MQFYHSVPIQIRFNDIDLAQHVNNSVYQQYFDVARMDYFRQIINDPLNFKGLGLVIASFRVDFFQPVFIDDKISVQTKIISFGTKSMEMLQQVVRDGQPEPLAEAITIMVCFDYRRQASDILPDLWKARINDFENSEVEEKSQLS